jgi:replicative DNA helicase
MNHDEALLGAVLSGYPDVPALARVVSEPDFEQARHGAIWQACLSVHKRGEVIDAYLVAEQMGSDVHRLPGGPVYLIDLAQTVTVANAPWYADKVREQSLRRKMRDVGSRMVQAAETDLERTAAEWAKEVRKWVDEVGTVGHERPTMSQTLEEVFEVARHGEPHAIMSPWPSLDELIGGFYPGQLVTFAARPGAGKSIALMNVGAHMATGGHVAFSTLEMFRGEVVQRMVAREARVALDKLRKGTCEPRDWKEMEIARKILATMPLHIEDRRPQTTDDIRAHAWEVAQIAKRAGSRLSAVVVDYVQIVRSTSTNKNMSRQQQVGQITQDLKNLAGELEVPVITAAQLNRSSVGPNVHPDLTHLREAGDIENDSDVVVLMHEELQDDGKSLVKTGAVDMIVAKNRSGPTGVRTLHKYGHYAELIEQ